MSDLGVIVLAAGEGKRMKSEVTKVMHPVCGKPMVYYPVQVARQLKPKRTCVVVGRQRERVAGYLKNEFGEKAFSLAVQEQQLGTGHAVGCCANAFKGFKGDVVILYGDTPLLSRKLVRDFISRHRKTKAALSAMTAFFDDPAGYGRIVRGSDGEFRKIVEKRDCTPEEFEICEVNLGIYCVDAQLLFSALKHLDAGNDQGELYLTDIAEIALGKGKRIVALPIDEAGQVAGVNDRFELAGAEEAMRLTINEKLARSGVGIVDLAATYIDTGVQVGADTRIEPGVILSGKTRIGTRCIIETGCRIVDTKVEDGAKVLAHSSLTGAKIRAGEEIGPLARITGKTGK